MISKVWEIIFIIGKLGRSLLGRFLIRIGGITPFSVGLVIFKPQFLGVEGNEPLMLVLSVSHVSCLVAGVSNNIGVSISAFKMC